MPSRSTDLPIGRLLMADVPGTSVSPHFRDFIASHSLGGVTLFTKNIEDVTQVARLCRGLQAAAAEAGLPPLLIAIDQEGGSVERLPLGMPGAMALGATRSAAFAERAGALTGQALLAAGVNVNFAPVLDVNTNPANPVIGIRSFGDDPAVVASLGDAYARGLQGEGVMATAKHFPGHGDTSVDSHLDLPVVPHALRRLEAVEFRPFREVSGEIAALMTAHVAVAPMGMTPATLSPALLDGIVRQEWGFEGIIFTDSLAMAAIADHIGVARAGVLALLAGADVLLALGGEAAFAEVFAAVRQAVADGILTADRLERSFLRLERFRERMAHAASGGGGGAGGAAGDRERQQFCAEVAAAAVTLVRNENHMVPLAVGPLRVVTLAPAGEGPTLGSLLSDRRRDVEEIRMDPHEGWVEGNSRDSTVVVTYNRGTPDRRQVEIVRAAHGSGGDRLIVVATGTPYDLAAFPEVACYVATYGREPVMLEAAARLLTGEIVPRGRLPVSIPQCHPAGWGVVW